MKKEHIERETVRLALDIGCTEEFNKFMNRKAELLPSRIGNPEMSVIRRLTGRYDPLTISFLVFTETQGLEGNCLLNQRALILIQKPMT